MCVVSVRHADGKIVATFFVLWERLNVFVGLRLFATRRYKFTDPETEKGFVSKPSQRTNTPPVCSEGKTDCMTQIFCDCAVKAKKKKKDLMHNTLFPPRKILWPFPRKSSQSPGVSSPRRANNTHFFLPQQLFVCSSCTSRLASHVLRLFLQLPRRGGARRRRAFTATQPEMLFCV